MATALERLEKFTDYPDPVQMYFLREKTPQQRLEILCELWRFARGVVMSSVRYYHPDWTEEQVLKETAKRMSHGAI